MCRQLCIGKDLDDSLSAGDQEPLYSYCGPGSGNPEKRIPAGFSIRAGILS